MCKWCQIASQLHGSAYMCRPCWRKHYRNARKKGK